MRSAIVMAIEFRSTKPRQDNTESEYIVKQKVIIYAHLQ